MVIAWKDKYGTKYAINEIDDRYLMNILNALKRGIGDKYFVDYNIISNLVDEAFNRGLLTKDEAEDMLGEIFDVWEMIEAEIDYDLDDMIYGDND